MYRQAAGSDPLGAKARARLPDGWPEGNRMSKEKRTDEPHDRLTRICAVMTEAFDAHPEHREGDKCIVFLDDDDRGGIQMHGYDTFAEGMADLMRHVEAMFKANGLTMTFVPVDEIGEG